MIADIFEVAVHR